MDDLALANKRLAEAGVTGQARTTPDGRGVEYRFLVPLRDGRHVAFLSRAYPRVEVGAGFAKRMKRKLKKVAKSKAFRKFAKVASFVAPFAAAPGMLISGVGAAKRAAKKAPPKRAAAPKRAAPKRAAPAKRAPPPKRAAAPKRAAPKRAAPAKRAPPPKRAAAPKRAAPPKKAKAPKRAPAKRAAPRLAPAPVTPREEALAMEVDPSTDMPIEPEAMEPEPMDEAAELEQLEPEEGVIDTTAEEVTDDEGDASDEGDEGQVDAEIGALLRASDAMLAQAGVQVRSRWVNGRFEYQYLVPLADGRMVSFAATLQPTVEIGAGRIAKKIKRGIKKVAKSKAFGKVLKGLGTLAKLVPIPGASSLGQGLDMAAKAQKLAQKGKKAFKAVKGAVKGKKKKPAPKRLPAGKPATTMRAAAVRTAAKPKPQLPATRPLTANKGTIVQLKSGRKAIVTFVQ